VGNIQTFMLFKNGNLTLWQDVPKKGTSKHVFQAIKYYYFSISIFWGSFFHYGRFFPIGIFQEKKMSPLTEMGILIRIMTWNAIFAKTAQKFQRSRFSKRFLVLFYPSNNPQRLLNLKSACILMYVYILNLYMAG
jgi:hypothetical protein